ncbi:Hypothetical protein PENO1_081430 [Penicillium occitanis (nom. inval.)]|nr:Hypothetical protein PENO1_081430 [Penicillium occitanis (nom. inval.)]PCH02247.1 hypothetical protein PENOC_044560 [Penicillium occitanis (nom. inval.)]
MLVASGKRKVSSCIPCYTRKQKCDRQYPCNHCTRRRRVEDCNYFTSEAIQQTDSSARRDETEQLRIDTASGLLSDLKIIKSPTNDPRPSSIAEVFGYSDDSHTNTLALLLRGESYYEEPLDGKDQELSNETVADVQQILDRMPERPILDFLMRYFVAEVNWIDQLIYLPWFLEQYQLWWTIERHSSVFDFEFAVTILRICSYTSEFLPSRSCTIEKVRGMNLTDIRQACDDVSNDLAIKCTLLNPKGGLLRVQHLAFAGLKSRCEGRVNDFRDNLKSAIQVAQNIGIDMDATEISPDMGELEKEMRRRVFCNLYVWDSLLSRQLDRNCIFPYFLNTANMPRMRLGPELEGNKELDEFTERLLQARLANFWKSARINCNHEQDFVAAEERYEKFCNEYLATLPSAFALQPNTQWDAQISVLPKQRELFHISIFESLCYNFRSVLLHNPRQAQNLPKYKQVLLLSQRRRLAVAALNVLKCAASLHAQMGGSQTRFPGVIRPTFEAAVLLISIPMGQGVFEGVENKSYSSLSIDPLEAGMANLEQDDCTRAVRDALARLQMLGGVSQMAEMSAQALLQLLQRMTTWSGVDKPEARAVHPANSDSRRVFLPGTAMATDLDYSDMNWEELASGL